MKTMTSRAAKAAGYRALTLAYELPAEQPLLDRARADLRRGKIEHVLVARPGGVAVWRRGHNGGRR